mmetsp:Transcript_995/g.1843  ORF Transcript_995/g.1843 Transcript_995/m.1843 type:complete len:125 (+) Transcript_995:123-497(+)
MSSSPLQDGMTLFAVDPRSDCPHVHAANQFHEGHAIVLGPCGLCADPSENWVCLHCQSIFCSRYVQGHMAAHNEQNRTHCIAVSLSDFSVWCYLCDSYITHPTLDPVRRHLFRAKFSNASGSQN